MQLDIHHRHGIDTFDGNDSDLRQHLFAYVKEWWGDIYERGTLTEAERTQWEEELEQGKTHPLMPEKPKEAIEFYFDRLEEEYYDII